MVNLKQKTSEFLQSHSARDLGIAVAALIVLYFLFDLIVMPLYTRQYQAVQVPAVMNLSFSAAEKVLADAGLHAVKGAEKYDETFPAGFVLFQNPEAGSAVKKGRRVYLTVGKGERLFPMPRLIGMAERDAQFALADLNLVMGEIVYESDPFYPEGVISAQAIEPGIEVAVGQKVHLVVSSGLEPYDYIVPELVGKSLSDALLEVEESGLTLGSIEEQETDKLLPNTVISQSLAAGMQAARGDTLSILVSKLPKSQGQEQ